MASLNLSTNGPLISKSYRSIVDSPAPTGPAANSSTYGQWAVYSVSAPLANAFQQSANQESVLKIQSTGEGELRDLIDEFSDGRIQYAFVKVKDPNTTLPKSVFLAWCGEGVPERTKGYFTSHTAAVARVLHGYHVQITARSDRDLTPDSIVQKVADSSGSKYSGASQSAAPGGPPPPVSSKPAFTPTQSSGAGGFNPLASKTRVLPKTEHVDEDGWGADAPPVTRTQLEKVKPAYQPTKVDMRELSSQKQEPSRFGGLSSNGSNDSDVIKGGYQPIGKVDIAAIRREAQQKTGKDDRPEPVKGSYEPVGKVDIAAIRARAQKPSDSQYTPPSSISPAVTGTSDRSPEPKSLPDRSAPFSTAGSERLTTLPKPKVGKSFGSGDFTGTKAPTPGGFGLQPQKTATDAPMGSSRSFAASAGKTPAQLWAEKKAAQGGGATVPSPSTRPAPLQNQTSGEGGWKSGYQGKSWAPVQTMRTGQSATSSVEQQRTGPQDATPEEAPASPAGGVSSIRDRFKGAPPMGVSPSSSSADRSAPSPPPLATFTKPNAGGVPMPGLPSRPPEPEPIEEEHQRMPTPPAQPPRTPTPEADISTGSPIRVAMPVARGASPDIENVREEQLSPPPVMPARSLAQAVPQEADLEDDAQADDSARAAGQAAALETFSPRQVEEAPHPAEGQRGDPTGGGGLKAIAQYDYEKAEDNELALREGEEVTDVDQVDPDWWHGRNSRGESGLFPSNYVELVESSPSAAIATTAAEPPPAPAAPPAPAGSGQGATATALYDYEAAEDNELSFPENATITNVEFPDDSWWSGEYNGMAGLFPANYVQLDE